MFAPIRTLLYRAMTTKRGDGIALFRINKQIARGVHDLFGAPFAPVSTEAQTRRVETSSEPAPVMVYMEKDRNVRERIKIEDTLRARNINYRLLDVSEDAATKSFVVQAAQCEEDDLPVVFVGGAVVGCYNELVQWDVSGQLARAVFGA